MCLLCVLQLGHCRAIGAASHGASTLQLGGSIQLLARRRGVFLRGKLAAQQCYAAPEQTQLRIDFEIRTRDAVSGGFALHAGGRHSGLQLH